VHVVRGLCLALLLRGSLDSIFSFSRFCVVPIVIYCKSGRRAARATEFLKSQGYDHVMNAGGLEDLKEMNLV
jgi:hypothetical protein